MVWFISKKPHQLSRGRAPRTKHQEPTVVAWDATSLELGEAPCHSLTCHVYTSHIDFLKPAAPPLLLVTVPVRRHTYTHRARVAVVVVHHFSITAGPKEEDCRLQFHVTHIQLYSCGRKRTHVKLIVSQRLSHQNAAGRRRRCCWHWRLAWTFCPGPYWPAPSALGYPPACRWSSARQPAHGLGRRRPPPTSLEPRLAAAAPSDAAQRPRGDRQPRVPPGRPPRVEAQ